MLLVYGASGHGKVVADAARAAGRVVDGFVDDAPDKVGTEFFGLRVLGGGAWLRSQTRAAIAWGIGDNRTRARLALEMLEAGHVSETIVHPAAVVAPSARIGNGTVVFAGVVVNVDAAIGQGVILNTGSVIEHDCVVGDYAHVSPNATLAGAVRIGARSHIGAAAVAIPGVTIGREAGTPYAVTPSSTLRTTTAPAPITQWVPARTKR